MPNDIPVAGSDDVGGKRGTFPNKNNFKIGVDGNQEHIIEITPSQLRPRVRSIERLLQAVETKETFNY